jgi:hypothetical protein
MTSAAANRLPGPRRSWRRPLARSVLILLALGGSYLAFHTPAPAEPPAPAKLAPAGPKLFPGLAPPLPDPLPIKVPALPDGKSTVALPAKVTDLCVGGGGRFLVFLMRAEDKLALFDVNEARIVRTLPIPSGAYFAAGMNHLVIADPSTKTIQRWGLLTGKQELAAGLTLPHRLTGVALGSVSDGPLVLTAGIDDRDGVAAFLDLRTLEQIKPPIRGDTHWLRDRLEVRLAADGSLLSLWRTRGSPSGIYIWALSATGVAASYQHDSAGELLPAPDGSLVYTEDGLYSRSTQFRSYSEHGMLFPAVSGNLYFALDLLRTDAFPVEKSTGTLLTLHHLGNNRPLLTLPELEGVLPSRGRRPADRVETPLPPQKRLFLIPQARLLITLASTRDKLQLRRFDLDEELKKSDTDYLFVASRPAPVAVRGKEYAYKVQARARKGPVTCRLEKGPSGMRIKETGELTWQVPADAAATEATVEIALRDAAGQEVLHTFWLEVADHPRLPRATRRPRTAPDPSPAIPVELNAWNGQTPLAAGIRPPAIKGVEQTVALPGPAGAVCAGGAGRYLIFHLPARKELALFDVNRAAIVKSIPCPEGSLFTAGLEDLFLSVPGTNKIERWHLATMQKQATHELPVVGRIQALAMGVLTRGPLLAAVGSPENKASPGRGDPRFLTQPRLSLTLWEGPPWHPAPFKLNGELDELFVSFGGPVQPRLSGDGQTLTWPAALRLGREGDQYKAQPDEEAAIRRRFIRGADDLYDFSILLDGNNHRWQTTIPALHGPFVMAVSRGENPRTREKTGPYPVELRLARQTTWSIPLPDSPVLKEMKEKRGIGRSDAFLIPAADLLVTVGGERDRLVLRRLSLPDLLKGLKQDYLFLAGQPPVDALRGQTYRATLAICSRQEKVKVTLDKAPRGMKLTPAGELVWKVPRAFGPSEAKVTLTARAGERSVTESFAITIVNPGN